VLAPLAQNRVGDTHTASPCLARRHRLAKSDGDDAATRAKCCPPDPSPPAAAPFIRIPKAPSRPCATYSAVGRASTPPSMSDVHRMNTLPSPSTGGLTCAPCPTLRTSGWVPSGEIYERTRSLVQHSVRLSFVLLRLYCRQARLQPDGVKPPCLSLEHRVAASHSFPTVRLSPATTSGTLLMAEFRRTGQPCRGASQRISCFISLETFTFV
jgi:hypothetical protein